MGALFATHPFQEQSSNHPLFSFLWDKTLLASIPPDLYPLIYFHCCTDNFLGRFCPGGFKVVAVGSTDAGKTSLFQRYVEGTFSESQKPTMAVATKHKDTIWNQSLTISLYLWDTPSQDQAYVSFLSQKCSTYYREADAALLMYDVTDPEALPKLVGWKQTMDRRISEVVGTKILVFLLATKIDLIEGEGTIKPTEEIKQFCQTEGIDGWFPTSAKENIGVDQFFEILIPKILKKRADYEELVLRIQAESQVS